MKRLAFAVILAACGGGGDDAPTPQVHDGFLHDRDGRAMIMRGVNLSGQQKVAPYLDDKTAADYARVRADWGFNAIRFIMTWSAVEPQPGQYDDAYLAQVAERLGWAHDAGLAVILEMHEDIYGEGFGFDGAPKWTCDAANYAAFTPKDPWFLNSTDPNVVACVDGFFTSVALQDQFTAMWVHAATTLADQPAVIGFDVLNEPNWGSYPIFSFEKDRLAPLYDRVVPAVRAVAPAWVAFLEPAASRNGGIATSLAAASYADVMYAPHSYDTTAESGGGFDPSHRQMIIDNLADLAYEAGELNAGLWIGEYGGVATNPGIVDYMTAQYDAAGAVAASTMYWSYDKSDGYSILDPEGNEKPDLINTLVRPYPERVAGTPVSYAYDAGTFTLVMKGDKTVTAPTILSVPDRAYPNGYAIECGGCTATKSAGSVALAGLSGDVTVTLHP
ncbi:MAG: cellulase family glycosylhydrolase [Kofleriaceae bacterium]